MGDTAAKGFRDVAFILFLSSAIAVRYSLQRLAVIVILDMIRPMNVHVTPELSYLVTLAVTISIDAGLFA